MQISRYIFQWSETSDERWKRSGGGGPNKIPDANQAWIVQTRHLFPYRGGKKLLDVLGGRYPELDWPHCSSACEIIKRNGLVNSKLERRQIGHTGKPTLIGLNAKGLGCSVYKVVMNARDSIYRIVTDNADVHIRFMLCFEGLASTRVRDATRVFTRLLTNMNCRNAS